MRIRRDLDLCAGCISNKNQMQLAILVLGNYSVDLQQLLKVNKAALLAKIAFFGIFQVQVIIHILLYTTKFILNQTISRAISSQKNIKQKLDDDTGKAEKIIL